jgi:hypothetical protein
MEMEKTVKATAYGNKRELLEQPLMEMEGDCWGNCES